MSRPGAGAELWADPNPIRAEIFGSERLAHHARSLAAAQKVGRGTRVPNLRARLEDNAKALLAAYRDAVQAVETGRTITPAAEWLLDNIHIVEAQIAQVRDDLPPGYYRHLPKLTEGFLAGYPRILGLAWACVAHTDSLLAAPLLLHFVAEYQQVQPLTIGELWALAISLRIVLVENMRRLAVQVGEGARHRAAGDALVEAVAQGTMPGPMVLPDHMAAQIAKRLRGMDPDETPLAAWLVQTLRAQGSSIDTVVQATQSRQGAANVTMRNIVTSMRRMAEMDWADVFEDLSLIEARLRSTPLHAQMDFATRNAYRSAIESLARATRRPEMDVTEAALTRAAELGCDPGAVLIGPGRRDFARALGGRRGLPVALRPGLGAYLAAVALTSGGVLALTQSAPALLAPTLLTPALLAFIAVDAGLALVNLGIGRLVAPRRLPGLSLKQGIPETCRTLVVMPVLLTGPQDLTELLGRLEVHHLSSIRGAVHFALLTDGPDADTQTTQTDRALIAEATAGIAALNARHGDHFRLFHRERRWNPAEGVWMGWERKRGKLTELNALLRGATDTSFMPCDVPQGVRFVVTLDADTQLPRDALRRMVGKMAHPLNAAQADALGRVVSGYGILQPHVTALMPNRGAGSPWQRITGAAGGMQPYAAARSDIWQDLFHEGSFTGKGIYDVDAFAGALKDRVPENTLLSHDLFEGAFARAGLASDIQVIEAYPTRHDVDARRQHRWTRGDWQMLPWILGLRGQGISGLNRWKMVDNLRRSLMAPVALAAVALGAAPAVLALMAVPFVAGLPLAVLPGRAGVTSRSHLQALGRDTGAALAQFALTVALLPDTAAARLDAILRSLWRLGSGRHLLEWTTAAQSVGAGLPSLARHYRLGLPGIALGALAVMAQPQALTLGLLWVLAPALAWRLGRTSSPRRLAGGDTRALRRIARRSWAYFETHVTEATHHLPPDNMQETPVPVVAQRTSPTNIGLYLLSVVAAVDMGWIGQAEGLARIAATLATVQKMPRFRGHLYNWHDTQDLRVLDPPYVSTVDSGNLAGHLVAVAGACLRWQHPMAPDPAGLADALALAVQAAPDLRAALEAAAAHPARLAALLATDLPPEARRWVLALQATHASQLATPTPPETARALALLARNLAEDMDFAFLMHPDKPLLSIGFRVDVNALDANAYDLLASEAQLASLFAISKGDAPARHWFQLGRAATPLGAGSGLISWSGSMFEYLMPALVLQSPEGSILDQTHRRIVARQEAYATALGLPWGISESAYNARDLEMTYQYSNFGVPGLGLKRGLGENRVIAPYATALAAMIDPRAALANFDHLRAFGAEGRFGFYEAVDFTPSRLPEGASRAVVQSFMAHHQGMTIVALANVVTGGLIPRDFHADPRVQSVESLLQEPVARDVSLAPPRAREALSGAEVQAAPEVLRVFADPQAEPATAHLLSNGRYGVVLTPSGAGGSSWGDLAVTRWRADPTQARAGSFIFLRDVQSGGLWSATAQPLGSPVQAVFSPHHAVFTHRTRILTTRTEVVISPEDDGEARRVTLTNTGRHAREIDVTSYAELILGGAAADTAHPAFSKLFVVTDVLPDWGVLIATRRRRTPTDPEVWAAHIAVVEGEETAPLQWETARERFIGRGRDLSQVTLDQPLSNTTGTVLDPVFALRRRLLIPGGGRARVTFWTLVAGSPQALLESVERHSDPSAFGRAMTLSWTQSRVELRHLGLTPAKAAEFQRLGGMVIRGDPRLRSRAAMGPQSDLWALGISGDRPILLVQIAETEELPQVAEVLAAAEYWQARLLKVDVVILNERASSYVQDLQSLLDQSARRAGGLVHLLRADLITPQLRQALLGAASVVLVAARGGIGAQLDLLTAPPVAAPPLAPLPPPTLLPDPGLEFWNGTGGFADQGRTYVTHLKGGQTTPAPWINVIANQGFGFQVSSEGSGFTWAQNARENPLTPWSNDAVSDPAGEAFYLTDLDTGQVWTPTALPIRGQGSYIARHGFGRTEFQHEAGGIRTHMLQYVPLTDPVKITRLTLHNTTGRRRHLCVTAYVAWVLGGGPVVTEVDTTGAVLARNPRSVAFPGVVAFADFGAGVDSLTCDRAEVIGRRGDMARPARLSGFSGRVGAGLDPCAALARRLVLEPGATVDLVFALGQAAGADEARALILRTRHDPGVAPVVAFWEKLLGQVQVETPDRAMDIMLNGWLLYQTLACRVWARAGFYQASGAYGFRDQLQDTMALTALRPDLTRAQLLRAAGRQFPEGDVQHWWLPHSGQGVRTHISDDRVWLGHCLADYIRVSGDALVLDQVVPFVTGPPLPLHEADAFYTPEIAGEGTLRDHAARGLDMALALRGENGLPLIGTGDWNDGMNRVGAGGRGTSVWLGWLLIQTLRAMAPHVPDRAADWLDQADRLTKAIEATAWDGAWYRRGTYDDGSPLGAAESEECHIDSLAQTWAVLSDAARPDRAAQAMQSLRERLIKDDRLLLFTPPFDKGAADPGYIKAYPPGLRENGGQYTHAALWAVLAEAHQGEGERAAALFALLNPVNHALTPQAAARYRVEPYVVAADVYDAPGQQGRGGWTWYTGSAAWMLRAGVEGILGLTREGPMLRLKPCLPAHWPKVTLRLSLGPAPCLVTILNHGGALTFAQLNGHDLANDGAVRVALADLSGELVLHLGVQAP
ncbi:DUF3131 domain-containing protein [Rhodobacter sp. KR11]|uniref:GH36-type glycosyl hydrolase domain-containing protein n=1 Tax=Rhodobacter sp. KR11 TaxID=2974588 RepID=UPI00222206EF|nr:glucoamylase family protein [Rhodobacter sp. KR11]MCW1917507.1 DUF3131 domain-containing protein [Rhodobacter sp. KR11]